MVNVEIGPCSLDAFEAGKAERLAAAELAIGSLYSWASMHGSGASVYPSRIFKLGEHAASGLLAVRFAILNADYRPVMHSYSLFDSDGLYVCQRNGLPFFKVVPEGRTTVEQGYFRIPNHED